MDMTTDFSREQAGRTTLTGMTAAKTSTTGGKLAKPQQPVVNQMTQMLAKLGL